jgi:hypothetical protein
MSMLAYYIDWLRQPVHPVKNRMREDQLRVTDDPKWYTGQRGIRLVVGGKNHRSWTLFDDSTTPPTLVEEGIPLHYLRTIDPKNILPPEYVDTDGTIRRTCDGAQLMETYQHEN